MFRAGDDYFRDDECGTYHIPEDVSVGVANNGEIRHRVLITRLSLLVYRRQID